MAGEGMSGFVPAFNVGGGDCNGGWGGNFLAAGVGAALGAGLFGNNWANGRNNGNCGCGCGNGSLGDLLLMNNLTTMRTDINSIGRDNMLQTAGLQSANCQGFAGVNASVERVGAQLAQNQSRTEAAVLTTGLQGQIGAKDNVITTLGAAHSAEVQGMRNTFEIVSSQKDCCCETNRNIERQGCETRAVIHAEGEATRALISQIDRERILRESCAKDAKIAALESQAYNNNLAAGYAQQGRQELHHAVHQIIGHMAAFNRSSGGGTDTGAAA